MNFLSGRSHEALLLLHGGAGPMDPTPDGMKTATASLEAIARATLQEPLLGLKSVLRALEGMEDDPQFNAGLGSALQADGKPRLTAAMMDGTRQSFSGVISVSDVRHPSRLAMELQNASSRVLTKPGCDHLAHQLREPLEQLITERRLEHWVKNIRDSISCDTVGAIVCHERSLFVGTSTGGRGFEEPGRVSDSATVAGTYASPWAAVSATGIGEELVDDALAARLETRVRDGMSLEEASRRCLTEAERRGRAYGWIACTALGEYVVAHTTPAMSFVVMTVSGQLLASSYPTL